MLPRALATFRSHLDRHHSPAAATDGYREGARAVLPIAAVIAVLGVVLGYAAHAAGLSPLAAATMSATTFAGGAQFAAIAVIGDGGTLFAALATAAALNARYALLGATLTSRAPGNLPRRLLIAHLTVDESWAVAYTGGGQFSRERLIGAGIVLLIVHVTSTALGATLGTSLGDPGSWGLDAALPALFVLLLWPRLDEPGSAAAAITGAAVALLLTPVTPPGVPILGAAATGFVQLRRQPSESSAT
jgi:predicted branched-subunit amino acid permease